MPQALALAAPAVFGAGGSAALFSVTGGLTLLGSVASVATSLALSAAVNALTAGGQSAADPQNIQRTLQQQIGARIIHVGKVRVGGTVVFYRAKDGKLYRLVVHGHGEISNITGYLLDGKSVTVTGNSVQDAQYQNGGRSRVKIVTRPGVPSAAYYSQIEDAWPEWDSTHKLNGLWTSLCIMEQVNPDDFPNVYPNGEPSLLLEAETAILRDPRGSAAYSDNSALVIAHLIEHPDVFNQSGFVDDDYLEIAADDCDDIFAKADASTEPRYRTWGSFDITQTPEAALEAALNACQGRVSLLPNGKARISVAKWREPTVTLTSADVLEITSFSDGPDRLDRYTELPFVYLDPDLDFQVTTGDTWVDATRETENGEAAVGTEADYSKVPSHTQGRRLAQWQIERDNPRYILEVIFRPRARIARYEDFINLDMPELPDVYWSIESADYSADGPVRMTLHSFEPPTWSTALEGQAFEPPTPDDGGAITAPTGLKAIGSDTTFASGAAVALAWTPAVSDALVTALEYSDAGDNDWQAASLAPGVIRTAVGDLVNGASYDFRIAFEASDGRRSPWSTVTATASTSTAASAGAPTGLAVADNTGGVAVITFTTANSPNLWRTTIRRDGDVIARVYNDPNEAVTVLDGSGAGTFDWTATSENISSKLSAATGAVTQTIT